MTTPKHHLQGLEYLKNVAPLSEALMSQLMDVLDRFEDSLTLSDVIGCLELVKTQVVFNNTMEYSDLPEDDEGDEGEHGEYDNDEDD
jgi:hypothetical protein